MSRRLVLLFLLTAFGCGGTSIPQDPPRHVPDRFEDFEAPPLQDAPLAAVPDADLALLDEERDRPLFDEWGGVVDPAARDLEQAVAGGPDPERGPEPINLASGDRVARLELTAPSRRSFVLRGTVPVPNEYELPPAGRTNLVVKNRSDGSMVPAQIEVVSRSPVGAPEVIEVLALVTLAEDDPPGQRVIFDVHLGDEVLGRAPAVPAPVRRLLSPTGDGILLRTKDVFGNVYEVDLVGRPEAPGFGSAKLLRQGEVARQRRVYGTLVPVRAGELGSPLPHLMGVHAYMTEWTQDDRVTLDLRVNNGAAAGSREPSPNETPAGIVYWESLELVLPSGWKIEALASDPFLGEPRREGGRTVIPVVKALERGAMHMMGPQAQFNRRLTLVPARLAGGKPDHPAMEGLAFVLPGPGLWSWFHSRTARYLPQKGLLPSWEAYRYESQRGASALRARLRAEREQLGTLLRTGKADGNQVIASVMGWCHPWFVAVQGGTGGVGVAPYQGHRIAASASRQGYEKLLLLHRMNAARQPDAQYNAEGNPIGVEGWLDSTGTIPFDFRRNARMVPPVFKLPALGGPAASAHVEEVHNQGLRPPYDISSAHRAGGRVEASDGELLNWMPHDGAHMARYTKFLEALVWLGNDALAKDDLLHAADLFQLEFHGHPHRVESWSEGITLAVIEGRAAAHPHHGLEIGRGHAWGMDAAAAAYALADDEWRARKQTWLNRVADLLLRGAMPSGVLQRRNIPGVLGGRYDACQTYQLCFLMQGVRSLNASVFAGRDEARRARLEIDQLRLAEYLFLGPVWLRQSRGGSGRGSEIEAGPRFSFAVAPPGDPSIPPYCDTEYWGEKTLPEDGLSARVEWWNIWSALEYAAILDDPAGRDGFENRFLRRAAAAWFAPGSMPALVERMFREASRSSNDDSGNWAGLVARLQQLSR